MFSVPVLPFEHASLQVGLEPYRQNFDEAFGVDGSSIGTVFPNGWAQSENGVVLENTITHPFPIGSTVASGLYNAGPEGSEDRTLAINPSSSRTTLQLLADVTATNATSFQLQFDVEAWDARDGIVFGGNILSRPDDPGEAAFNVTVEIDSGDDFTPLVDLGTVTTGANLQPVFDGIVDGNADANRFSFDSGIVAAAIPAGSSIRIRWSADTERPVAGWVFGLDNVSLSLLEGVASPGDFNRDGRLTVADTDLLTAEIAAGRQNLEFDLSGDSLVDQSDLETWLSDAAEHNRFRDPYLSGDANLDGSVDAGDLNNLALNWRQDVASWSAGDFNADGSVGAGDLNELALNWRKSIPIASSVNAQVPEPSALLLTLVGLALAWRRPKRS